MSRKIKNVALIGASGTLGPPIVAALQDAKLKVVVISRPASTATFPEGVEVQRVDYSQGNSDVLATVFREAHADAVISLVGGNALTEQKTMIDAALAAGVVRFIPSEFGANTNDDRVRELVPLYDQRKECTDYLDKLSMEHEKFSWTGIIAGAFFDWGLEDGFLDFDLKGRTANIMDSGTVPFCLTNLDLVAHAIRNILTQTEALETSRNTYVYIANHIATQDDILYALQEVTGEPWKVERVHSKQVVEKCKAIWEQGGADKMSAVVPMVKVAGWGDQKVYGGMPWSDDGKAQGLSNFRDSDFGLWNDRLGLPEPGNVSLLDNVRAVLSRR